MLNGVQRMTKIQRKQLKIHKINIWAFIFRFRSYVIYKMSLKVYFGGKFDFRAVTKVGSIYPVLLCLHFIDQNTNTE